ncbi:TPA: N-acetylmuramoyl-L-alanine amidase [Enterobacter asburiae]|nr:N-acetylmuramoyl-L-alanine amidase [Enterobacter asburiae]
MLLENGWLVDARHVPSPHHDCRPEDEKPTLLVVHNISLPPGEFGGPWIDALFTGTIDPDAQYQQLVAVTQTLIGLYPAMAENITGHSDIAPVRKTDPGPAFDWGRFRTMLAAASNKEIT